MGEDEVAPKEHEEGADEEAEEADGEEQPG